MNPELPRSLRAQDYDLGALRGVSRSQALWRFLTGYRWLLLLAALARGLAALARASFAYVIRYFTDEVLLTGQFAHVPWIGLLFLGLAAVSGALTFGGGRIAAGAAEGVVRRLRLFLYDQLQHLPFAYHNRMQTGELIQRSSSDVEEVRRLLAEHVMGMGRITTLSTMSFIALYRLQPSLALASAVVIPIAVFISTRFWSHLARIYDSFQDQEAHLSSLLQENLYGVRVVRAFAREPYEIRRFDVANSQLYRRGKRLVQFHNIYWPTMDIVLSLQMVVSIWLGARMAVAGQISPGTFLAFTGLLGMMIGPVRHLGRIFALTAQALVSFERIMEIVEPQREPLDEGDYVPGHSLVGAVRYANVSFTYEDNAPAVPDRPGQPVVLHRVSFAVAPGQVVAILGATGAGKSTLMNLLPRFHDYTAGHIYLDGVELNRYPRRYLRRQIGFVQQEPFLFSRSIRANITYGTERACTDEAVYAVARAANIHANILALPAGYDTIVGEQGVTLSGGQRQRIAIARTLLKDPALLILDDATSAVDADTEQSIREALQHLMQGRTTFIIAHRISSIALADHILVMDQGRIVQAGTHAELLAQPGIYAEVFHLQTTIEQELTADLETVLQPAPGTP